MITIEHDEAGLPWAHGADVAGDVAVPGHGVR